MSEVTDLTVIEIKPEQAPVLYSAGGLNGFLEQIRELAKEVPDVTTKKGRDRIGSLARMVGSSKTAIEKPGREYLKRLKEAVKPAEEELRVFTRECDAIRDAILKPRDEWEAEQERIKAEEAMNAMHAEALVMNESIDLQRAIQFEADHEMALLMNKDFDRDREEQRRLAEQAQRERDERLKQEAAEQARCDAEAKHKAEIEAAARREAEEKARAELAERQRVEAEQRAAREKQEAEARAEREKAAAVEAERLKAKQAEDARLAEEKRLADEQAKREADVKHRKTVGTNIVNALTSQTSLTREQAIEVLTALKDDLIPCAKIHY
ncbi:hypothetical protein VLJ75_001137 [Escherichia coli]|uniref:hypothetical protein n=1 Tax=Escherichia coli TaxID=562 RepID=UPI00180245F3|nr:hypothetical protein [Escherichia coli]EFH7513446.1 hypothetical protein [Escherichia coli]EHK7510584.1 hypothetical protein [Escherichia coli]EMC8350314.1 hypothetical protein [Escherichia coli]UAO78125.1 hypothetical protein J6O07_14025 [Escherichia coli]UAO82901.1 hypothetical protein J6O38_14025 [Escherichia coli]